MSLFTVILIISSTITVVMGTDSCPSSAVSCPSPWQSWGHACYRFTDESGTWDDSQSACQAMGGRMAVPYSQEENEFMMQVAQKENIDRFWIGCNDQETEGAWVCEGQGEGKQPFFNWLHGIPSSWAAGEDCAEAYSNYLDGHNLNDLSCSQNRRVLCVYQATCVNRPAQPACGYHLTKPPHYCFAANTNGQLLNSTCLIDHIINEFVTKSNPRCASACILEPRCRSFNIKHSNQGEIICQLNDATRCDDPVKFQDTGSFCIYSQECLD